MYRTERNRTAEGGYSAVSDRRLYICDGKTGCGLQVATASVMELVQVYDDKKLRSKWVAVSEYKRMLAKDSQETIKQPNMFEAQ